MKKKVQPPYTTEESKLQTGPGCLSDPEVGKLCKTGQYSTYTGNFYNPANEKKFVKVAEVFKAAKKSKYIKNAPLQERYMRFLNDRFSAKYDSSKNDRMMKDDFFNYVNEEWLKNTGVDSENKYYVQIDNFRIKQEEVYYKLIGYVKDYIKSNKGAFDQFTIALQNFYKALTNDTVKQLQKHAVLVVQQVDDFFAQQDMYGLLADINKNEIIKSASPICWTSSPDEKNVKQYISHLSTVQLGLYDFMIYLENPVGVDAETLRYYKKVKAKYLAYIRQVFDACLPGDLAKQFDPQHVWDIEVEMLEKMSCTELNIDNPDFYNLASVKQLKDLCDFDWPHFATLLGFKTVPAKVVVGNLDALKCLTALLKANWNTPKWKTYWVFIQFKQMIRFENGLRHIHFDFYNKFLEGQPVIMPTEIYPIFMLSFTFNTFLSRQYIKNNYNPLYVEYVKHLIDDLKTLFMRKIERNTWMMPQTRKYALHKLRKLEITVGVPSHLTEDPLFDYQANDPLANIGLLLNWKLQQQINLEGKPIIDIPTIDWRAFKLSGTQCYIVNAFYAATSNSIYIPLAIIQNPFIDLNERGLEYNLVYIGYTITHELSHSLDNTGSRYDAEGNMRDWWQPEDRKIYDAKIADVVKQYEEFALRDGIKFDASIGSGENLADISGLSIIEEYLMDNQIINNEVTRVKKLNLAKFYMNLAIQSRQKLSKVAIKAQLKMNPHPLDKYRVNCPLARLPLFRTIFDIKKGDGMWWHNMDTIW